MMSVVASANNVELKAANSHQLKPSYYNLATSDLLSINNSDPNAHIPLLLPDKFEVTSLSRNVEAQKTMVEFVKEQATFQNKLIGSDSKIEEIWALAKADLTVDEVVEIRGKILDYADFYLDYPASNPNKPRVHEDFIRMVTRFDASFSLIQSGANNLSNTKTLVWNGIVKDQTFLLCLLVVGVQILSRQFKTSRLTIQNTINKPGFEPTRVEVAKFMLAHPFEIKILNWKLPLPVKVDVMDALKEKHGGGSLQASKVQQGIKSFGNFIRKL